MKLCKNCEFLEKDMKPQIPSLYGRRYKCKKHKLGILLRSEGDIETLVCVK